MVRSIVRLPHLVHCACPVLLTALFTIVAARAETTPVTDDLDGPVALGRALFFDTNLSRSRTQSCATCHDPARAFTDGRDNGVAGAASLGDDGASLGDRNVPTLSYAALTPDFGRDDDGRPRGGFFHDGRAATLAEQAAGPLLNPLEMAMPDPAAVAARVRANPRYVAAFGALEGTAAVADDARLFAAVTAALASFERSEFFAPFDSRYDRWLRGEVAFTYEEELGRQLFFSDLTNCALCHVLDRTVASRRETFTDYHYYNVGIPPNPRLRAANGSAPGRVDRGLADNPRAGAPGNAGRFKVPTLRNILVTAPYMHNGVFRDLATAIHFYNRHIVDSSESRTNIETGRPWDPPEVPADIAGEELRQGQPLDAQRIAILITFLRTLTDRRYEALLPPAP